MHQSLIPTRGRICSGVTLLEATLTVVILSILASAVLPLQAIAEKKNREIVLKETLREIRRAIDRFRDEFSEIESGPTRKIFKLVFPKTWEELIQSGHLRRIPLDPITNERDWKIIPVPSKKEEQEKDEGGGIFDIRSLSKETAIDGSRYDDW